VVHSYAAACIERILLVKDKIDNNSVNRYGKNEIKLMLPTFLNNIFKTLETEQSKENDFLMKALMRVVATSQEEVIPYSAQIVNALVAILGKICKNPTNPSFNHYLFESISATIVIISNKSPEVVQNFEKLLFGPFTTILEADVQEFAPYVFQVLALLLERTSTVSQPYLAIFAPLTAPALWERAANIPALTRLMQAYLRKGASLIVSGGFLMPILGIFQKMIASKIHDHEGFYILESVVQFIPKNEFFPHLKTVFTLIFTRLSRDKTLKFMKSFLVFLAMFIGIHGPMAVLEQIDQVQKDLFVMILDNIWIPNIQKVNGSIERKMAAISMVKLLTECPRMLADPYFPRWPKISSLLIEVLEGPEDDSVPHDVVDIDEESSTGYTVFSQLIQAVKQEQDPFKEVDVKKYIAQNLYKLSREHPGKFQPLIGGLSPQAQGFLKQYFELSKLPEPYLV